MGVQESKPNPVRPGAYYQETPKETKGSDTAKRIRKQLQEGKVKPQQPNFPIQQYQPPQSIQHLPPQQPSSHPPPPQQVVQQPMPQMVVQQPTRKNIQIQPPRDMMRQDNQRRVSSSKSRPPDGRPPKPKSAKVIPAPVQVPGQAPVQAQLQAPVQVLVQGQGQPQVQTSRIQIQHQNIIRLSREPFLNCVKTDRGFLQNCEMSLAQLIQPRYNTKMYFPEQNVISLLESIIYALSALEAKQIRHHDIYPTTIFFHNGIFKLSNPILTPLSSYALTLQRKRFSYLSPELIIHLRQQIEDVKEDLLFRSDVFSFGMIMLEFCSLKPSQECYDAQNYDIIDTVIRRRLAQVKQIYNPLISEAIDLLLRYEVQQRIPAFEFAKLLNQHVHQHQMEIAAANNAKKSQLNIQGELQSPRSGPIAPNTLPNGFSGSQSQLTIQQPQQQLQQIQQIQLQPQVQQYQPQQPQPQSQPQPQPQPQQIRQPPPSPPPPQQIQPQHIIRTPVSPSPQSQSQYQYQPQYNIQPSPLQHTPQSQSNSRLNIISPLKQIPQQNTSYPLSPFENQIQPTYSSPQSYPYVQSPINPISPESLLQQIERNYPPPSYANQSPLDIEVKNYNLPSNEYLSKYSSPSSSSYAPFGSNSQYSQYNSPQSGLIKTLGELQYNIPSKIPSYRDNLMKPQKDTIGGGYKDYMEPYKDISTRQLSINVFKDRQYTQVKHQISSQYTYGGTFTTGLSSNPMTPRNQEQSLEERVRRILQKSKQIK